MNAPAPPEAPGRVWTGVRSGDCTTLEKWKGEGWRCPRAGCQSRHAGGFPSDSGNRAPRARVLEHCHRSVVCAPKIIIPSCVCIGSYEEERNHTRGFTFNCRKRGLSLGEPNLRTMQGSAIGAARDIGLRISSGIGELIVGEMFRVKVLAEIIYPFTYR